MRRRRGEGTITKRKDGRFEAAAYINTPEGIKRVRRYSKTRTDAEATLVELRNKNSSGLLTSSKEQKFGDYLDYWLLVIKHTIRQSTFVSYETTVRLYLKPGLGNKYLTRLSVSDVQTYLDNQSRAGQSNRNLQKMRVVLSAALKRASQEERVIRNVARLAEIPMYKPKEVVPWSINQLGSFLDHANEHPFYPIFILMSLYGLRTGEALGLSWSDIDLENKIIHIRQQVHYQDNTYRYADVKTRAGRRDLPLLDIAYKVLVGIKYSTDGPLPKLIFKTSGGLPIDSGNLRKAFQRISKSAELPIITLHHLRHTAATNLKNLGIAARDAQSILGHAHISTTLQIYQHADIEEKSKALEEYEQKLGDVRGYSRQMEPSRDANVTNNIESNLGAPGWTRTTDLRLRSPLLYPAELPGRMHNYILCPHSGVVNLFFLPKGSFKVDIELITDIK